MIELLAKKQRRQMRLLETLIREKRWFHLKELAEMLLYRAVVKGGSFKFTDGL